MTDISAPAAFPERSLILGGLVLDCTGSSPRRNEGILVEGNRIVSMAHKAQRSRDDVAVIDAEGTLILPGLFNLHEHISRKILRTPSPEGGWRSRANSLMAQPIEYLALHSCANAGEELRTGVTTIRDFGLAGYSNISLRRAIDEGLIVGPRILAAGVPICMTGGHGHPFSREADGVDGVVRAVREQIKHGADCIKLMASAGMNDFPAEDPSVQELTYEELAAGVAEAHKLHRRCAAHVHPAQAVKDCVRAGMDSIEHGAYIDDEGRALMIKSGTGYVPTVSGIAYLPRLYRNVGMQSTADALEDRVVRHVKESIQAAWRAGVKIGIGSDSGGTVAEEIETVTKAAGMSAQQGLEAATRVSADIAGLSDQVGTLEGGKIADIILADREALDDVRKIRNIRLVMRGGRVVSDAGPDKWYVPMPALA